MLWLEFIKRNQLNSKYCFKSHRRSIDRSSLTQMRSSEQKQKKKYSHLSRFLQCFVHANEFKVLVYMFVLLGVVGRDDRTQLWVGFRVIRWDTANSTTIQYEPFLLLQLNVRGRGAGGAVNFVLPTLLWGRIGRHSCL